MALPILHLPACRSPEGDAAPAIYLTLAWTERIKVNNADQQMKRSQPRTSVPRVKLWLGYGDKKGSKEADI